MLQHVLTACMHRALLREACRVTCSVVYYQQVPPFHPELRLTVAMF